MKVVDVAAVLASLRLELKDPLSIEGAIEAYSNLFACLDEYCRLLIDHGWWCTPHTYDSDLVAAFIRAGGLADLKPEVLAQALAASNSDALSPSQMSEGHQAQERG